MNVHSRFARLLLLCALIRAVPAQVAPLHETITVTAKAPAQDVRNPDPAQRVLVRDEILDANPGHAGAPVSIPGLPVETASGGIKAPQYFAPGVAGDHGEPIASFLQVGGYLVPNNLSANAHGNGYSDPNLIIPALIESVQTDGGAFNVLEGNHSVNLAATYSLHVPEHSFAALAADYRDVDFTAGWRWLTVEAAYGNGFLQTPEHRRQYKFNALRGWDLGCHHHLTALLIGYFGDSRIPGLVPVDVPGLHDTIDPRQRDQTHTGLFADSDSWHPSTDSEFQFSGFFRTYNLSLISNFGDGLIRQSEFRTSQGGNTSYERKLGRRFSLLAGADYFREAPRRDDLDRYFTGDDFEKVTANNLTIQLVSPFIAVEANLLSWLRFNLGWRRDEIGFANSDLLTLAKSFSRWRGMNSPKANLSIVPPGGMLPSLSFSFGQAFYTDDPRTTGDLISRAHAYQLVVSERLRNTDFRLTLGHITQEASLAKIDPDTGLQFNEGPGRNRYATISARHLFASGMLQASFSKADARDLSDGSPTPEAPRMIFDASGAWDRLPLQLHAKAEFENVGRKPLGDGFASVPVREFRVAFARSFHDERIEAGVHFQIAAGYTGQTTEVLALPGEGDPFERVVGVALASYATASLSYRFGKHR